MPMRRVKSPDPSGSSFTFLIPSCLPHWYTTNRAVIGDDPKVETEMARTRGAIGVGVTSGTTSRETWAEQPDHRRPDHVIESVADLLAGGWLG